MEGSGGVGSRGVYTGPDAVSPTPNQVKERPFFVALLLYLVTFGIYRYWYHYASHDEACREVGRPNKEKVLFGWWLGTALTSTIIAVVVLMTVFASIVAIDSADVDEVGELVFDTLITLGAMAIIGIVAAIASVILFIIYVAKQYEFVQAFRAQAGLPQRPGAGWFFGFYYGATFAGSFVLPGISSAIFQPIAYHNLVEHYNDVRRYFDGRLGTVQASPASGLAAGTATTTSPPGGSQGPADDPYGWGGSASSGQAPRTSAPADEGWGRQRSDGTFSLGGRNPSPPPGGSAAATSGRQVEQTFKCPRCHEHVTARGPAGGTVAITCASCGESGEVPLPRA